MIPVNRPLVRSWARLFASSWCATAVGLMAADSQVIAVGPAAPTADLIDAADPLTATADLFGGIDPAAPIPHASSPSQNVTVNLVNLLVQRGVLTQGDASGLIAQAEQEAAVARAQAEAETQATDNAMRVTYIPDIVKAEMREQIKNEVLAQARAERFSLPDPVPGWVRRFKVNGDIRLRYEGLNFDEGNNNTGAFPNFNAINTGAPFDISGTLFSPQYNVDQDRRRMRLRARLGAEIDLEDGFSAGLRIATGENNSPITTNQTLGLANQGQGGNFSKYAIWLDRAYFNYSLGNLPEQGLLLSFGRFENPFFATDIIYDEDLGFDGLALHGKFKLTEGIRPFLTAGVFPVFNTDLNFSSNQPAKFESTDKWLYGVQFGFDLKPTKNIDARVAGAYYNFQDVEGELSDPYTPLTTSDAGNTDNRRPSFAQKGNTYMALRNIVPSAINNFGTTNQYQYFGLATPFKVATLTGRIDFNHWEPYQISLVGEWAKNLAWDMQDIEPKAINNRGPNQAEGAVGRYDGGDTAWYLALKVGKPAFERRWDWNASVGYRYIESDAVIDGFNDSEFGGGGTNVKGFTLGAQIALSRRVRFGVGWMSANQIAGPPLKADTFLFDLHAKF